MCRETLDSRALTDFQEQRVKKEASESEVPGYVTSCGSSSVVWSTSADVVATELVYIELAVRSSEHIPNELNLVQFGSVEAI